MDRARRTTRARGLSLGGSASAGSLREAASVSFAGTPTAAGSHPFLRTRFQAGSVKNSKINYSQSQKVFHGSAVPPEVAETKKKVEKQKKGNILGTEPAEWNISTVPQRHAQDLRSQLLLVRAGMFDEPMHKGKPSKQHSDEAILDLRRFISNVTGQTIGKCGGSWTNLIDERGLARHTVKESWPDWNNSHSCHTKEDIKQAQGRFDEREEHRRKRTIGHPKVDKEAYVGPTESITNVNDRLRERKIDFQEMKEQFKIELKAEFPNASEERLQALAQRLLNEKLLADEKMARFPVHCESFRPNIAVTSQDRRYREYFHPGTWTWQEVNGQYAWSCCSNFGEGSRGCEYKVVNPDAWCTLGFERRSGQAVTSRRTVTR